MSNYYHYHYHRHHYILHTGLFSSATWASRYQQGKTSLDLNEARRYVVLGCSGISWTICKQSAPRSRHVITEFFTGLMLFL